MKLTIRNYNIIAGVKLIPGWELTEVKEYEEQYEFCCRNMTTGENRYLRKHSMNDNKKPNVPAGYNYLQVITNYLFN